jgi:hypothetical protein
MRTNNVTGNYRQGLGSKAAGFEANRSGIGLPDRRNDIRYPAQRPQPDAKAEPYIHTMRWEWAAAGGRAARPSAARRGLQRLSATRPLDDTASPAANRRPTGPASSVGRSSMRAVLGLVKGARA